MAVTMINTLYPPVIETFQPAFVCTESAPITFSLSAFNIIQDIKKIHVSVVDQRNNTNVLKGYLPVNNQVQSAEEETEANAKFCIVNGILIAEIPTFTDLIEKQQIGLFQYDPSRDIYAINIDPAWLNRGETSEQAHWNNNQYYQVQIRFDSYDDPLEENIDYSGYLIDNRKYFSEWSSVTLIKPILKPVITITQLEGEDVQTYPGNFHISGSISFEYKNLSGISTETERLQSYRIRATVQEEEIFSSDWVYGRQNILKSENTTIDYLLDLMKAKQGNNVTITIDIRTNNGYIDSKDYTITIISYQQSFKGQVYWNTWATEGTDECKDIDVNQEDGIVKIRFRGECPSPKGVVYFRRACSKDHYKKWHLIYKYELDNSGKVEVNFDDFTVGSLYTYKYNAQLCTINSQNEEIWGEIEQSNPVYLKFYEMLFMRQNRQIAIRYNGQISSWKPTVNRQKIDTLGGRYPKFVENATMNYKTYSISGLISAEEDFNRKFLNEFDGEYVEINGKEDFDYYYQDDIKRYDEEFDTKYVIRNDTLPDGEHGYNPKIKNEKEANRYEHSRNEQILSTLYPTIIETQTDGQGQVTGVVKTQDKTKLQPHDLYPQNHWYWEREFRETLIEWLNDGEPKLYRSMPEGNIAVMLTDINLSPNPQLGRRIYNFSATMYEVADGYDLEQLDNLGIINIPKLNSSFINGTYANGKISEQDEDINIGYLITKVGQINISSVNNPSDWVNSTRKNKEDAIYNYTELWDDMSLREKIDEYYYGNDNDYELISNSIKLKNIDIYFTSSPNYFERGTDGVKWAYAINNNEMKETPWLGYKILIQQKGKDSLEEIFINQKGYYHIPDPTQITKIVLPTDITDDFGNYINNPEKVSINCVYQYRRTQTAESEQHIQRVIKHIVGQYTNDILPLNTDIIPLIYQNHEQNTYVGDNNNKAIIDQIHLAQPQGFMLDVTPYTYLEYEYKGNNTSLMPLIIGETGVFDGLQDWPITSLYIKGRRLVEISEDNYPFHIEEWNYYKDKTVQNEKSPIEWKPKRWYQISDKTPTIPVVITINDTQFKNIQENWYKIQSEYNLNPEIYGYLSTQQIVNPKFNTVYTFLKSMEEIEDKTYLDFYYQIYYIDGQWYPVDFMSDNTILAAVPIYGMINYHGDLVKERS